MAYVPLILTLLAVLGAGVFVGPLLVRLSRYRPDVLELSGVAADEAVYDVDHYQPMARLLDPAELEFVASQAGVTRQMAAGFRRERRKIFRAYLQELTLDFNRLHRRARKLAVTSPTDQSDLIGDLVRQQVVFWKTLSWIELQLTLDAAGVRNVNPQRLVDVVNGLSLALERATTVPGPVLA